ncbi:hypothetical protein GCM10010174_61420 [Kutzneria viridogrisea]|uniref:Uncharacterized protein n=1 Tax=Kutzneria viridogrisea TaxID=47990 RepID=A0ABR6BGD5_9PSEU|nr:hypothetical protein [Kutzneria viridogrisea]
MVLYRAPGDFLFGTLSVAAALGDTTIQSSAFASLGTGYSTSIVLPIVLLNTSAGTREVVWITGHTSASTSVTVIRGKENTTAQAWASGTQWICAPTAARDTLGYYSAAQVSAMTDQHVGMEVLESDTGLLKKATFGAGWVSSAGMCLPAEVGKTQANGTVPSTATILKRVGCVISATPSSGNVGVTFSVPFPNGIIGAVAGSIDTNLFVGVVTCQTLATTGFTARPVQLNNTAPGLCSLYYEATGW